jgi:hypothetical protein
MKPPVLLASVVLFCAAALASQPELPRAFGILSLGMSEAQVAALGVRLADGCPGCVDGERYAGFRPEHPSESVELETSPTEVEEAFFFRGRLYSLAVPVGAKGSGLVLPKHISEAATHPLFRDLGRYSTSSGSGEDRSVRFRTWTDSQTEISLAYEGRSGKVISLSATDLKTSRRREQQEREEQERDRR